MLLRLASRGRTRAKVMVLKEQHRLMISVVKRVNFAISLIRRGEKKSEFCGDKGTASEGETRGEGFKRGKEIEKGIFFFFF